MDSSRIRLCSRAETHHRIRKHGGKLFVLDMVFPEVANAIWKRHRQKLITLDEARGFIRGLITAPVRIEPALTLLSSAVEIAMQYDRAVYDALFVALSHQLKLPGITADEPLYNVIHPHFPQIALLRNWQPASSP